MAGRTQWDFQYDGDGSRVKQIVTTFDPATQAITGVSLTGYFMGGAYETTDQGAVKKYYAVAGMTVAMSERSGDPESAANGADAGLKYLLTDHREAPRSEAEWASARWWR